MVGGVFFYKKIEFMAMFIKIVWQIWNSFFIFLASLSVSLMVFFCQPSKTSLQGQTCNWQADRMGKADLLITKFCGLKGPKVIKSTQHLALFVTSIIRKNCNISFSAELFSLLCKIDVKKILLLYKQKK